jgi:hypothetical protein
MKDLKLATLVALTLVGLTSPVAAKTMIDYFQPIPIRGTLTTSGWGIDTVGPRDPDNGIEDIPNWRYWDGKILKADDGKYHLFCSKWQASKGIAAWLSDSVSVHAVSDNVLGPYKEVGPTYSYQNGRGHNTTGVKLIDGTYAVIESAIVPGWIFKSSSLDGPFNYKGSITWDDNGFRTDNITSNLQIMVGPDKKYWAISGSSWVMNADDVLGPYKVRVRVYQDIPGMDTGKAEDPIIWYSGGYFHVVYNYWNARKAYHIMSRDGVTNWKNMGVALDRSTDFIRYTDGTVNHWGNMERPNVVMENGHVTHFTFAVTDVNKDQGNNCCSTGTKVIVVPFDGVAFDADNGGETGGSGGAGGSGGTHAGGSGGQGTAGAGGSGGNPGPGGGAGTVATGGVGFGGMIGNGGASGGSSNSAGRGGSAGTGGGGNAGNNGSGGVPGASGATGTGGSGSGGTAGSSGHGGSSSAGSTGTATSATNPSSGCSCATNATRGSNKGGLILALGIAIAFAARRHSRTTRSGCSTSRDSGTPAQLPGRWPAKKGSLR